MVITNGMHSVSRKGSTEQLSFSLLKIANPISDVRIIKYNAPPLKMREAINNFFAFQGIDIFWR